MKRIIVTKNYRSMWMGCAIAMLLAVIAPLYFERFAFLSLGASTTCMGDSLGESGFEYEFLKKNQNARDGLQFAFVNPEWHDGIEARDFIIKCLDNVSSRYALRGFTGKLTKSGYCFAGIIDITDEQRESVQANIEVQLRYRRSGEWHDETYQIAIIFDKSDQADGWQVSRKKLATCRLVSSRD
jgi:hypothetical protein